MNIPLGRAKQLNHLTYSASSLTSNVNSRTITEKWYLAALDYGGSHPIQ